MRILHISQSMDPRWGGPPKITACIASSQAAIGHEVSIAARAEQGREDSIKALLGTIPGMDKVAMELLEPVSPLREILSYKAGDGLEELVRSSDVVHIHNVWDPFNIPAAKLARKHSKPHYILLNGMLDPWCMNEKRLKKNILMKLRWREFLDGATALHCGNRDEIELIKPLGLTAPREMIPNGVFPDEIAPPTEDAGFFKDHPELADLKIMLFMSRLHHKKGLDHLAESFAIFARDNDDVHLVVAGPEEGSGDDFRARISRHGIDHRVHMVGPVYGPQKWQLLHASECFVLTSHQEGFSVAITEALGCSLPCLVSSGCHYPEVQEAGAGRVTSLDHQEIASAMHEIFQDESTRQEMARAANDLVMSRFTWPKVAEQTVAIYEKALGPEGATGN